MEKEDSLAVVLSEFARTLVTDFSIEGILDHLVRRIVDILPIEAAGVSLISPTTRPHLIAGSDESAVRYEHLQTELGEGPCLAAYTTSEPVSVPDLTLDQRFPRFAEQARTEGLVAVFTFPSAATIAAWAHSTSTAPLLAPSVSTTWSPPRPSRTWPRPTCSTPRRGWQRRTSSPWCPTS